MLLKDKIVKKREEEEDDEDDEFADFDDVLDDEE